MVEGLVRDLVRRGHLVRLSNDHIVAAAAVAALRDQLRATGWRDFDLQAFKERFGLSRKWAIPLLERLDQEGVTRRVGDRRELRIAAPADPREP